MLSKNDALALSIVGISLASGIAHVGNSLNAANHITHFGQFFAGMTFFIITLLAFLILPED